MEDDGIEWKPLTESQLIDWTSRLRAGERGEEADGIARAVMMDFSMRYWHKLPQSSAAMGWIVDALDRIMGSGKSCDELGLIARDSNRPRDDGKAIDVALWIQEAEKIGYTEPEAKRLAADCFCMTVGNVRKLVNQVSLEGRCQDSELLASHFLHIGRPLPDRPLRRVRRY